MLPYALRGGKMKKKILKYLCFSLFFIFSFNCKGENDEIKSLIVSNLQSYSNKIFSFTFFTEVEMVLTPEGEKISNFPINKSGLKIKYVVNGNKYRQEIEYFDHVLKKETKKILCFDGMQFYLLESNTRSILSISKGPIKKTFYLFPSPLLTPFAFICDKGDDTVTLNTLQNPQKIENFKNSIKRIWEGRKAGFSGFYIQIEKDENIYEIFWAKELNYYPIFFQKNKKENVNIIEETWVRDYLIVKDIVVPTFIEAKAFKNGKLLQIVLFKIDKSSLSVNIPIEEVFFSIPFIHADKVWDCDNRIWLK
jgi:hypothetical protein